MADLGTCRTCGKPLEYQRCPECSGSGKVRWAWLIPVTCSICNGSTQIAQCPDSAAHFLEKYGPSSKTTPPSPKSAEQKHKEEMERRGGIVETSNRHKSPPFRRP
jgi:DnaJ-class molecular chaperone